MFGFGDKNEAKCPLLRVPCIRAGCIWWKHLVGRHPQTGKDVDEYDCAINWLPILLVENAGKINQVGAAIESSRNEVVKIAQQVTRAALAQATAEMLNGGQAPPPALPGGGS